MPEGAAPSLAIACSSGGFSSSQKSIVMITDRCKLLTLYENPVILANRQHKSLLKGGFLMQVPTPIVCCAANCG
jgi:hypothetical protein